MTESDAGVQPPTDATTQQLQLTALSNHNSLQPIATLPPEILSTIFLFLCPPSQYTAIYKPEPFREFLEPIGEPRSSKIPSLFVLCCVSSYWRQVAISTPSLWKKLEIHSDDARSSNIANLIDIHATRSSSSLDIILWLNNWCRQEDPFFPQTQLERAIFVTNPTKIQKLSIHLCPVAWLGLFYRLKRLTHLSLCFCACKWVKQNSGITNKRITLDLRHLPLLSSVSLETQLEYQPNLILPMSQINEFILRNASVPLPFLTQCPNLINFHYTSTSPQALSNIYPQGQPRLPITFEKVENLTWKEPFSDINNTFKSPFKSINFPSLRHLKFIITISSPNHSTELLQSLPLLPLTLRWLEIDLGCLIHDDPLTPFFEGLGDVMPVQVEVFKCVFAKPSFIIRFEREEDMRSLDDEDDDYDDEDDGDEEEEDEEAEEEPQGPIFPKYLWVHMVLLVLGSVYVLMNGS